jgi:hypothetical protein
MKKPPSIAKISIAKLAVNGSSVRKAAIRLLGQSLVSPEVHYIQRFTWEDERVRKALEALRDEIGIRSARINVRRGPGAGLDLKRADPFQAIADSAWLARAKAEHADEPTLIVAMQAGLKAKGWDNERVYLPVLVMPRGRFAIMYNYSG